MTLLVFIGAGVAGISESFQYQIRSASKTAFHRKTPAVQHQWRTPM